MKIREACDRVLGKELAASIISDKGINWCVVAAMTECKLSHGPEVKAAINAHNAELSLRNSCSHPWAAQDANGSPYCAGCGRAWSTIAHWGRSAEE